MGYGAWGVVYPATRNLSFFPFNTSFHEKYNTCTAYHRAARLARPWCRSAWADAETGWRVLFYRHRFHPPYRRFFQLRQRHQNEKPVPPHQTDRRPDGRRPGAGCGQQFVLRLLDQLPRGATAAFSHRQPGRAARPHPVDLVEQPARPVPQPGLQNFPRRRISRCVDSKTRNYNDFNVIAGRPYNYEVRGINIYGEGQPGKAIGFQVPNGVVTGWVQTPNGNPVPNTLISLTPLQGFSAMFGFDDGALYRDTSPQQALCPGRAPRGAFLFGLKPTRPVRRCDHPAVGPALSAEHPPAREQRRAGRHLSGTAAPCLW
jgi:hypothetical protein